MELLGTCLRHRRCAAVGEVVNFLGRAMLLGGYKSSPDSVRCGERSMKGWSGPREDALTHALHLVGVVMRWVSGRGIQAVG